MPSDCPQIMHEPDLNSRRLSLISPLTGKQMGTAVCMTDSDVNSARNRARIAENIWRETQLQHRLKPIKVLRNLLCERQFVLSAALVEESGRPLQECLGADLLPAINGLDYLLSHARKILQNSSRDSVAEPYGTVGIIGTWNYPIFLNVISICQAIAAGNCVLWKPSELALHSAEALNSLLQQCGLPDGVFQMLPGDTQTGRALTQCKCDLIVFTGGVATGRQIMANLAPTGTPSIMELSGNDPFIVDSSADIDTAARCAVWARVTNAGQSCVAPQRFYVVNSVVDKFLANVKTQLHQINHRDFTPLRTEQQVDRCISLVDQAVKQGASCLIGGYRDSSRTGFYLHPALLANCNDEMGVVNQDVFGPILPVIEVGSVQEAVARSNSSELALGASIWSRDDEQISGAVAGLKCGIVSVNEVLLDAARADCSFGGMRSSGNGKLRGPLGLEAMVVRKMVYRHKSKGTRRHLFPYMPAGSDILTALIDIRHKPGPVSTKHLMQACIRWSAEMKATVINFEEKR